MTPAALAELVRDAAAQVLAAQDVDDSVLPATVTVERPRNPQHGDYASNVALHVATKIGASPRDLAGRLAAALGEQESISSATVAGPGFVNLRLATGAQTAVVRDVLRCGESFGRGDLYRGLRVNLQLVSADPTGPLGLSGARLVAVADALARILSAQDAGVVRECSINGVGAATHLTADLESLRDEQDRAFDLCLYLVGADHHRHVTRLKAAATVGDDADCVEVLVGQLVTVVREGRPLPMCQRVVTMNDLVDAVGIDAARYALVRSSVDTPAAVDLDLMSRCSYDNPVFSVQYAHARLSSLQRNADALGMGQGHDADLSLLTHDRDAELIRTLGEYPRIVQMAARMRQPHRVARYLEELAGAYHRFYDMSRVLQPGDDQASPLTIARLQLCAATRQVLANGLGLLGVSAPEQM